MTALNHRPTKRRNLTRWMEARLRRIDHKLEGYAVSVTKFSPFEDFSPASIARCRDRGHSLATDIQASWAKTHADKIRASLNTVSP